MVFEKARDDYEQEREEERVKLCEFLERDPEIKRKKLKVVTHWKSGRGDKDYTAGGKIAPYDLRNWKWVELKAKGFSCVISLNMPIVAPSTQISVVLCNRIGLYLQYKVGDIYYKTEIYTDIDLPLNVSATKEDSEEKKKMAEKAEANKQKLVNIISKQFDHFCELKGKKKTSNNYREKKER